MVPIKKFIVNNPAKPIAFFQPDNADSHRFTMMVALITVLTIEIFFFLLTDTKKTKEPMPNPRVENILPTPTPPEIKKTDDDSLPTIKSDLDNLDFADLDSTLNNLDEEVSSF